MSESEEKVSAAAEAASAAEKKPVRRTRSKKAETTEAASEKTASAKAEKASAADDTAAPKRRTRKAAAPKSDAPAAEASAVPAADTAAAAEAKPVRRRTRKAAEAAEPEAAPAAPAAPAEETPAQDAPKPRRRTRKAASEEAAAAPEAAPAAETTPAVPVEKPQAAQAASAPAAETASEDASQRSREKRRSHTQGSNQDKKQDGSRSDRNDRDRKRDRNDRRRNRRNQQREVAPSVTREELAEEKVADLRARAAELQLDVTGLKKAELVEAVFAATAKAEGFVDVEGILDVLPDGYGFLRTQGYLPGEGDVYVGLSLIRRNNLRKGDYIIGKTRPARENEKYAALQKVERVNGIPLEEMGPRVKFGDLTPVYPDERLWMEHGKTTITARVIDLAAPIGKGQRGLIVSPPKAGKTTVLKDIAASISANNPEVHLMCLLVDERPEEVTDMERSIKGEVVSSTFDMPCENHIAVAELVIERAKRLVENGKDVVILLDSLTRLARAYNLAQPASGRILSGGVDSTALYPPKKFLGAARNIENGGSLTILASALIDTGSKMDEVIFEEFKGTGNMELKLDRNLADRRIFPAIDPVTSGTRKEDLLLDPQEAPLIWAVRRLLSNLNNTERAMDMLIKSLKQTNTNQEFLIRTAKKAQSSPKGDSSLEL